VTEKCIRCGKDAVIRLSGYWFCQDCADARAGMEIRHKLEIMKFLEGEK